MHLDKYRLALVKPKLHATFRVKNFVWKAARIHPD